MSTSSTDFKSLERYKKYNNRLTLDELIEVEQLCNLEQQNLYFIHRFEWGHMNVNHDNAIYMGKYRCKKWY
jgi:hypothetical protein